MTFGRSTTDTSKLLHGAFAEPTLGLRFVLRDGQRILQQEWRFTEYNNGEEISRRHEWCRVPLVEALADETK